MNFIRTIVVLLLILPSFALAEEDTRMIVITDIKADSNLLESSQRQLDGMKQDMEMDASKSLPPSIRLMPAKEMLQFICSGASCEAEKQKLLAECDEGGCKVLAEKVPADYFIFGELSTESNGKLLLRISLFNNQNITLDRKDIRASSVEAIGESLRREFPVLLESLILNAGGGEVSHLATVIIRNSTPPGMMVFLNGRFKTSLPEDGSLCSFPVPAGEKIKLEFRKNGFRSKPESLPPLADGETKEMNVLLPRDESKPRQTEAILNIESDPDVALILIDGVDTGKTTPADFSLPPHKYTVTLRKAPLYVDKTIVVDLTRQAKFDIDKSTARLNKKVCGLFIDTKPSGAQIEIRGPNFAENAKTPFQREEFPVGRFEILLSKVKQERGFELPYNGRREIIVTSVGLSFSQTYELRPAFGQVEIKSDVEDGSIVIDGRGVGEARDITSIALPSGSHRIEVSKDWHYPFSKQVTISDGVITPIYVTLKPNYAEISLEKIPCSGEIFIDEKSVGKVAAGQVENRRIEPGYHKIRIVPSDPRFKPLEQDVNLKVKESRSISLNLSQRLGTLYIRTNPTMAEYSITGDIPIERHGTTADRVELAVGRYLVRVSKGNDYAPTEAWFEVEEGQETQALLKLAAISQTYRTKSWVGWSSMLTSVALAGGGAFMFWQSQRDFDQADKKFAQYQVEVSTANAALYEQADELRQSGNKNKTIAVGLWGGAGATLIFGSHTLLSRPKRLTVLESEPNFRLAVMPGVGSSAGWLTAWWRW
jgi:hypothetical protein